MENSKKENVLRDKSYGFALRVVGLYKHLSQEKKEFVLSKQLLRSGTAIGALVEEANQGESKADFIHKLSIANKEANETRYWIRLLTDSGILDKPTAGNLIPQCEELIKLLTAILKTAKERRQAK